MCVLSKMVSTIEINETNGFACLSNYSLTPFRDNNNVLFKSSAQAYYYYMCSGDINLQSAILYAKDIRQIIHIIGYEKYANLSKPNKHKALFNFDYTEKMLYSLLLDKLSYNPHCVDMLLATWGRDIVVVNGHDCVLGCGQARRGLNLTGRILMELREHFRIIRMNSNRLALMKSMSPFRAITEAY